jgi:hypothetical protein
MAIAYLRVKTYAGRFDIRRTGVSLEDFAVDCIADLFRRDFQGAFPELIHYFGTVGSLAEADDALVTNHLRRLVFSAVNHRIFRTFRETDPSLAKIIRNLKLIVKDHPALALTTYLGESVLTLRDGNAVDYELPRMAPELIAPEVRERIGAHRSLRHLIDCIGATLSELHGYRRAISLIEMADLIRSIYAADAVADTSYVIDPEISEEELQGFIHSVIRQTTVYAQHSYAHKNKLSEHECKVLVASVHDILVAEYIGPDGEAASFLDILRQHVPDLNVEAYRLRYRTVLEYLVKLAKQEMQSRLKKEFENPRTN